MEWPCFETRRTFCMKLLKAEWKVNQQENSNATRFGKWWWLCCTQTGSWGQRGKEMERKDVTNLLYSRRLLIMIVCSQGTPMAWMIKALVFWPKTWFAVPLSPIQVIGGVWKGIFFYTARIAADADKLTVFYVIMITFCVCSQGSSRRDAMLSIVQKLPRANYNNLRWAVCVCTLWASFLFTVSRFIHHSTVT